MRFHKQVNRHDPANGIWGDCFRTAVACLLNLEPKDVPHFLDGGPSPEEFRERFTSYLSAQGYCTFQIGFDCDLDQIFRTMNICNPGVYYLISGQSPRGTTHVCIGLNDKIIHDPAIDGGGLVGPCTEDGIYWIEVLMPLAIHKAEENVIPH